MCFFIGTIISISGSLNAQSFRVNEYTIESVQIPRAFNGYRILFISDLHINSLRRESYFKAAVQQAMDLQPDIILLGGDYVDGNTDDIIYALGLLDPWQDIPVIFVLGNHDNWSNRTLVVPTLQNKGFVFLENDQYTLQRDGESIIIAGLADYYSDSIDVNATLDQVQSEDFCILISHSPEPYVWMSRDNRMDLMLSGHTHGGQITLFGLWAPVLPLEDQRYWRGSYYNDLNRLIISNGIGFYNVGIRVFARPSMELIELKSL
jgi:predicted MPP superfamily phosphohydrolase